MCPGVRGDVNTDAGDCSLPPATHSRIVAEKATTNSKVAGDASSALLAALGAQMAHSKGDLSLLANTLESLASPYHQALRMGLQHGAGPGPGKPR